MDTHLNAILLRFPEYKELIAKAILESDEFEALCSEYDECVRLLESIRSENGKIDSRRQEYDELRVGLEQEVLKHLF